MVLALVSGLLMLVPFATAGNTTDSTKDIQINKCKDRSYLDNCLGKLPPIIEASELKGIPSSKREVDASCSAFKTGMGCIDQYSKECLNERDRSMLQDHTAGARYTFKFLCDDPGFQAEYLKYTTCYKGISKDWDSCANRFVGLVKEELSRKNASASHRVLELCCAKHGFLKCVYVASRLKCRKEEAIFIRKIADTLSNMRVYSPLCGSVDVHLCSSADTLRLHSFLLCWFVFCVLSKSVVSFFM